MATLLLALRCPRNVGSPNRSCKSGAATKLLSAIRLPSACVMYTSCISPNLWPCLTRTQHFAPICRSATTTRAGRPSVSPSAPWQLQTSILVRMYVCMRDVLHMYLAAFECLYVCACIYLCLRECIIGMHCACIHSLSPPLSISISQGIMGGSCSSF